MQKALHLSFSHLCTDLSVSGFMLCIWHFITDMLLLFWGSGWSILIVAAIRIEWELEQVVVGDVNWLWIVEKRIYSRCIEVWASTDVCYNWLIIIEKWGCDGELTDKFTFLFCEWSYEQSPKDPGLALSTGKNWMHALLQALLVLGSKKHHILFHPRSFPGCLHDILRLFQWYFFLVLVILCGVSAYHTRLVLYRLNHFWMLSNFDAWYEKGIVYDTMY